MLSPHDQPVCIAVIGGGPAGLMAALAAAESGARVTLFERQPRLGRKLDATGGGRCNLTNTRAPEPFMQRFGPRGRFMTHALRRFGRDALLALMRDWGVACAAADGFHYFPLSQRAADVRAALETQLKNRGVQVRTSACVTALDIDEGHIQGVLTEAGLHAADAVILAAGGAAWPALGGCTLGYDLARQAGHTIVEPAPALVGLTAREVWPKTCAGVTLPDAAAWIDLPGVRKPVFRGELLFTHAGLSGPVILDLSGQVSVLLRARPDGIPLKLNLFPETTRETWRKRFEAWRTDRGKKSVHNLVDELLPHSLAVAVCEACLIEPEMQASRLPASTRDRLLEEFTALPLTVTGSEGMARAMVTRGGVALDGVNPATLESRQVRGLFFAGEALDLDGPCGGYNLQWAFSSGHLAGHAAAEECRL